MVFEYLTFYVDIKNLLFSAIVEHSIFRYFHRLCNHCGLNSDAFYEIIITEEIIIEEIDTMDNE